MYIEGVPFRKFRIIITLELFVAEKNKVYFASKEGGIFFILVQAKFQGDLCFFLGGGGGNDEFIE